MSGFAVDTEKYTTCGVFGGIGAAHIEKAYKDGGWIAILHCLVGFIEIIPFIGWLVAFIDGYLSAPAPGETPSLALASTASKPNSNAQADVPPPPEVAHPVAEKFLRLTRMNMTPFFHPKADEHDSGDFLINPFATGSAIAVQLLVDLYQRFYENPANAQRLPGLRIPLRGYKDESFNRSGAVTTSDGYDVRITTSVLGVERENEITTLLFGDVDQVTVKVRGYIAFDNKTGECIASSGVRGLWMNAFYGWKEAVSLKDTLSLKNFSITGPNPRPLGEEAVAAPAVQPTSGSLRGELEAEAVQALENTKTVWQGVVLPKPVNASYGNFSAPPDHLLLTKVIETLARTFKEHKDPMGRISPPPKLRLQLRDGVGLPLNLPRQLHLLDVQHGEHGTTMVVGRMYPEAEGDGMRVVPFGYATFGLDGAFCSEHELSQMWNNPLTRAEDSARVSAAHTLALKNWELSFYQTPVTVKK